MSQANLSETADREIISSRVIPYTQADVFDAFRNPDKLKRWWGPNGFTSTFQTFEFQPGGTWEFVMHGPDGTDYPNTITFVEILEPERIVFDHVVAPLFQMAIPIERVNEHQTRISFHMVFETATLCEQLKLICTPANEENFDRLEMIVKN